MIPITDPLMYDMQIHSKVINISILISLKSSTRWKILSESNNNTIIFFTIFTFHLTGYNKMLLLLRIFYWRL